MKYYPVILTLLCSILSAGTFGQEREENDREPSPNDGKQQVDRQKESKDEIKKDESPTADIAESFKPSEEISEDLSVSFPVDI